MYRFDELALARQAEGLPRHACTPALVAQAFSPAERVLNRPAFIPLVARSAMTRQAGRHGRSLSASALTSRAPLPPVAALVRHRVDQVIDAVAIGERGHFFRI